MVKSGASKKVVTIKATKPPKMVVKAPMKPKADPSAKHVLILRTCNADLTSHNGFKWPESGPVSAPDWKPTEACGNGLHGLRWGEGDADLANWSPDAKWLVVSVEESEIIDLAGKVKFPKGEVVHCGDRLSATTYLADNGGGGKAIIGGTATAGNEGTATAGYRGTATAGNEGTATAGYRGTATAGNRGTATAGNVGTATAGDGGTATAGYRGTIAVRWWDNFAGRYRTAIGYIGEDGLLPNTPYRLVDKKWVAVNNTGNSPENNSTPSDSGS